MKIVGICGSPRRGGNTEKLLDAALLGARRSGARTKKIILNELSFKPCQACGGCDLTGRCVIRDGMGLIYKSVNAADGIIIASPVYFGSVSAQLKMMIDRFHCEWVRRFILGSTGGKEKKGVFLCVSGAGREKLFVNSRKVARIFFKSIGVRYCGEVFCGDVDAKGAIKMKKDAMDRALKLGRSLGRGMV